MLDKMAFLSAAENRGTFFKRIALLFPTLDPRYKAIEKAYNSAKDAFRGKVRESGERYFEHIRAVTLIQVDYLRIKEHELIIASLLHDIVEDVPSWTVERVNAEFGPRVAMLVEYLTKPSKTSIFFKEERERIYHERFRAAPRDFFLVKLPDRLHNLTTLWACPEEKILRKISETKMHYLPYAERELILLHEIEEAIAALESKMPNEAKPS